MKLYDELLGSVSSDLTGERRLLSTLHRTMGFQLTLNNFEKRVFIKTFSKTSYRIGCENTH